MSAGRFVATLSAAQVRERITERSILIQPCGSLEQHGDHLPLGSDTFIASRIAEYVVADVGSVLDLWLLPPLPYGKSNEHAWSAGTVALSATTLLAVLDDLGRAVASTKSRKLVFLNGHGGNYSSLSIACRDLRQRYDLMTFLVFPDLPDDFVIPGGHPDRGLAAHSGHEETSLLMHLEPGLVDSTRAVSATPDELGGYEHIGFGGPVEFGWTSDDFGPTGVIGDATAATAEAGAAIFEALVKRTKEQLTEIERFQFSR